jgi:D-sedoheptulose 7-phosphate isomerase
MDYIQQLIRRYPSLDVISDDIQRAYGILEVCFAGNGKLLVAGNGGSASDADHISGELMKSFVKRRPVPAAFTKNIVQIDGEAANYLSAHLQGALPVIPLIGHNAIITASANDTSADIIFAQQVYGYGSKGDVFLGISTSGNSKNIYYAMLTAKVKGMQTIALVGRDGGMIAKVADTAIIVPEKETYKIQELHLPIYHTLCLMLEEHFFPE